MITLRNVERPFDNKNITLGPSENRLIWSGCWTEDRDNYELVNYYFKAFYGSYPYVIGPLALTEWSD